MRDILVFSLVLVVVLLVGSTLHTVDEGHVGIYWRGGALLEKISDPGYHVKFPFLTSFEQIQTSVQTDRVVNIPCGTSGGSVITFDSIEVVNRLKKSSVVSTVKKYGINYDKIWIFDKIHHEINQFCSSHSLQEVYIDLFDTLDESLAAALQSDCDKWNTGIEIIATRVTKPRIPATVARNYEQMEIEKTQLLISHHRQKVVEKLAETERLRARILAEQESEVARIASERLMMEKKATQKIQTTKDTMYVNRQKAKADAEHYQQKRLAEANSLKLTPEFLRFELFQSIANRDKIFFGSNLSELFASDARLSALMGGSAARNVSESSE